MFPTFIGILDIQSWWEVPSIAHFCSLFRAAFNLLDFDIEDLEEALLTDGGTEGRLLQELIVKLLEGCLPNDTRNDISTFNYQMFLRRLFRKKCQEYKCENPFNTDVDFELLPLRQKVEILRALCDFRLDAEDVEQSLSNLDSDSLRVEPLGHDRKNSAYWYFYGTRLYREDYIDTSNSASYKQKSKPRDKKRKKRRNRVAKEEQEEEEKEETSLISGNDGRESVWQVVCFTQQDWSRLVEKFRDSEYDTERKLYRTLSEDFMPEIPKLFDLKEKQQRRKLLQRNSSRVLRSQEPATQMDAVMVRSKIRTKTTKGTKKGTQASKSYIKEETSPPLPTPPVQKKGRQTNNSLASAVGQIVIHTRDEVEDLEKKKGIGNQSDGNYVSHNYGYKYGYSFGIEEEERCVGMHKVLESVKDHVDAWPFIEPVDEDYAPRYYSVVRRPMDLKTMEEKLENGSYKSLSQFKRDFRLIVDNCRQYNGSDNEYTDMAFNLKEAFNKAVSRYLESETSSDEDATSPRSLAGSPTSLSHPSRHLSSSHHNARKRSKKSTKKSKSYKPESKIKSKSNEKVDEDEKRNKSIKVAKKKRGKKKGKKVKEEELDEDEEEQEDQESEDAISETSIVTSKRRKNVDVNSLLKTKKQPKESEGLKTSNKKASKERHQSKKDSEIVRSAKEMKENKKRKEDFEEDYEPPVITKSKSRKIEKKELEQIAILTDNTKKSKLKKIEVEESDTVFEEDKKQSSHVKTKKNRKKEKSNLKTVTKSDEKSDKSHIKQKNKKSKKEELKNGELKSQTDSKDVELESALDSKHTHISKKLSTLIGNKDVDSLDSLKDKISDRRREEKLKNEKEKQRKAGKSDTHGVHSKKVPSNISTFHDNDKDSAKRSKSKKSTKEDKTDDTIKKHDPEINENKKSTHAKHTKGLGAEENATIQALNQATEKTLHDINKWLDDAPRLSGFSSGSDSPVLHTSSIESSRSGSKVEAARKRPSSIKIFGPHGPSRPKKIQRTIDRLQPGKSKGNLLLKKPLNVPSANTNDAANYSTSDNDQSNKDNDEEPKLSLGTVLKNVDSIQLICKSLVSSPNPNLSNDEEEDHSFTTTQTAVKEEKTSAKEATKTSSTVEEKEAVRSVTEETQKPKSATPNLSAWIKAFGAPKSKKKDEEAEEAAMVKKDGDSQEAFCGRQRRLSTGGSSVSESVSSFSQESPPAPRAAHSPQCQPVITPTEPIRGAGFYQDALSAGSSPYNSPYYATPPRYSAQLPPTPSPQNHPLSPAYPSYEQPPSVYPQVHTQPPYQSPYQKSSPQDNAEAYPQMSPQRFPQQLSASNQNQSPVYPQHSPQAIQPVYPQPSPQTPPSNYSQPSPQQPSTPNYSQPSPQQNAVANYSQSSPQAVTNYPQASPQQQHSPYSQSSPQTPPNYSQPSLQQQSPYAQSSPQQPAGYGRLSPQPPPTNYSQSSPQPPNAYAQPSPQPPNFSPQSPQTHPANYSQPSPQPPNSYPTPQHDRSYSQSSHQQIQTFPQHSPQASSPFSEPSPQNSPYSQSSPQSLTNYPQSSPQQPATYSHPLHSPQTPPNYSQLSPQQTSGTAVTAAAAAVAVNYSQPSPQSRNYPQSSPQQKPTCNPVQPPQQSPGYPQSSPQQTANYSQLQSSKNSEEYAAQATVPPANYPQDFKQNPSYIQQSPTISSSVNEAEHRTEYLKSNTTEKPATSDQQRNFPVQSESLNLNANHQIYQSPNQYPPTYPNSFSNIELQRSASRHSGQQQTQQQQQSTPQESRTGFTEIQPRGFLGKAPSGSSDQLPTSAPDQPQLLAFQQNLTTAHESLYPSGFQPSGYSLPPPNSRPVYPSPHYFDAGSKSAGGGGASGSPSSNPPPMKKRAYEPPSSESNTRGLPQESTVTRSSQEQFSSFEPMMTLSQPEAVSVSQFDGTPFVGGLADSMATNSAYARLSLGLVGRASGKEQQQLLTIPRPPPGTKPEHLAAYSRSAAPAELEQLNLLQSLQAAKNSQGILAISRRAGESDVRATPMAAITPTVTPSKTKRSRKSKHPQQQEQPSATVAVTTVATTSVVAAGADQQQTAGMPAFPQYATASAATAADSISALKTAAVAVPPPAGSAFNFAASASGATTGHAPPFPYDKDATAAAAFAFLTDEFRNPGSYYNMALRQQQQQQQQQQSQPPMVPPTVTSASGQPTACNKLSNQPPPRNYPPPHSFLHSAAAAAAAQRSAAAAYVPPVSAYVTPHGPNLTMDQAAYQQYIHSLYALQPPPHHHRPSWL